LNITKKAQTELEIEQLGLSLKSGKIGVIPTDTIYGICTSALNPKSVEKIYDLRKRAKDKPMIILISSLEDIKLFDISLSDVQQSLLESVWPNPVSIILPVSNPKFEYLHRGKNSLALRMPKNDFIHKLLEFSGSLVAPSANFEGEKPAESIDEAKAYFGEEVEIYIDNGPLTSPASTLIDLTSDKPEILRQGSFKL
jgi:L-threonylcarbamoyladenylate synthase